MPIFQCSFLVCKPPSVILAITVLLCMAKAVGNVNEATSNVSNFLFIARSDHFTKEQRLLSGADFNAMRGTRLSVSDDAFLVLAKPQDFNQPRLGLAIAKKYAKLAVQRNTIKRIVRESFRRNANHLPSLDIVVLARQKTKHYDKKQLHQCIESLWKQLAKRAKRSQASSSSR